MSSNGSKNPYLGPAPEGQKRYREIIEKRKGRNGNGNGVPIEKRGKKAADIYKKG